MLGRTKTALAGPAIPIGDEQGEGIQPTQYTLYHSSNNIFILMDASTNDVVP